VFGRPEQGAIATLNEKKCHGGVPLMCDLGQVGDGLSISLMCEIREQRRAVLRPCDIENIQEAISLHALKDEIDLHPGAVKSLTIYFLVLLEGRDESILECVEDNFAGDCRVNAYPGLTRLDQLPREPMPSAGIAAVGENDLVSRYAASYHRAGVAAVGCDQGAVVERDIDEGPPVALNEGTPLERCQKFHRCSGVAPLSGERWQKYTYDAGDMQETLMHVMYFSSLLCILTQRSSLAYVFDDLSSIIMKTYVLVVE
jgi:hypothetical protein